MSGKSSQLPKLALWAVLSCVLVSGCGKAVRCDNGVLPPKAEAELQDAVRRENWDEYHRLLKQYEWTENREVLFSLGFGYGWFGFGDFPSQEARIDTIMRYFHEVALCGDRRAIEALVPLYRHGGEELGIKVEKAPTVAECLEVVLKLGGDPAACGLRMYRPNR